MTTTPEIGITSFTAHPDGIEMNFRVVREIGCYVAVGSADEHKDGIVLHDIYCCPMNANGTPDFENIGELEDYSVIPAIKSVFFPSAS